MKTILLAALLAISVARASDGPDVLLYEMYPGVSGTVPKTIRVENRALAVQDTIKKEFAALGYTEQKRIPWNEATIIYVYWQRNAPLKLYPKPYLQEYPIVVGELFARNGERAAYMIFEVNRNFQIASATIIFDGSTFGRNLPNYDWNEADLKFVIDYEAMVLEYYQWVFHFN